MHKLTEKERIQYKLDSLDYNVLTNNEYQRKGVAFGEFVGIRGEVTNEGKDKRVLILKQ